MREVLPQFMAILAASLLGNLHCGGMCGAFVAVALRLGDPAQSRRRNALLAAYNLGRLITYGTLGAFAGALGSALDAAGTLAGIGRAAALVAGAVMILFGGAALARLAGWRGARFRLPRIFERLLALAHSRAAAFPPIIYALFTGLLTTLLPCGWLYAFVAVAGGTASASAGALVMFVFWIGTLPVLLALGLTLHKATGPLARRLPALTAALVLFMGLYTIGGRLRMHPRSAEAAGANAAASQAVRLVQQVQALFHEKPACCTPEAQP